MWHTQVYGPLSDDKNNTSPYLEPVLGFYCSHKKSFQACLPQKTLKISNPQNLLCIQCQCVTVEHQDSVTFYSSFIAVHSDDVLCSVKALTPLYPKYMFSLVLYL